MKRRAKLWSLIGLLFASFTMVIAGIGHLSGLGAVETSAESEYESLYDATFTEVATHSYTQNKTFTLNGKSWKSSVSQVNAGVFYLGCNSNNESKGILNNNSDFSDIVTALAAEDATYRDNKTTAHAYSLLFENAYSDVTKISFGWSGGNNAFQVYLFGYSAASWNKLANTNYATSGASVAGSVTWTGDKTNFTKFAVVARPGAANSTATSKTLRAAAFEIFKTKAANPTYSVDSVVNGSVNSSSGTIDGEVELLFEADSGYRIPDESSFSVSNASYSLTKDPDPCSVAILTISDATANVSISVSMIRYYNITKSGITNGSATGATFIDANGNANVTLSPNPGYSLPASITVVGASYEYSDSTGVVVLSNPTGAVTVSANMVQDTYNVTVTINHGSVYSSGDYITTTTSVYGGTADIFFQHAENYGFPELGSISVSGATIDDYVPEFEEGIACLSLTSVTGPVSVTITCTPSVFSVTTTITGDHGTYTGDDEIVFGGNASVTVAPNEGYKLPATVTVIGATSSYNATTGVISLSNPTGAVSITVEMDALTRYDVTVTIPAGYGSKTGATYIYSERTATVTITPNEGYTLSDSITVTGASYEWNASTGVVSLSNPTANVTISGAIRALVSYEVTVSVTGGTYVKSSDTDLREDQSMTVTFTPSEGYKLPDAAGVIVANATKSYNATTGVLTISNPTDAVNVTATMVALTQYSITVNETNATHTGATYIYSERTANLVFEANVGCFLPNAITVTGATYTWNKTTGTVALSNPTANVVVTVNAVVKALDHITVAATKTSFTIGDAFSFTGTITAYDNDETSQVISNDNPNLIFTGYDRYTIGLQTIAVNYLGKEDTYSVTVAAAESGHHYEKVTTAGSLASGDYLIVAETASVVLNGYLAAASLDSENNYISVSISQTKTISSSTAVDRARFTWDASSGTLISHAATAYRIGTASNGKIQTANELTNTISIANNGTATIASVQASGSTLQYNSGGHRFRYYSSSQNVVTMYRYVEDDPEMVGISASLSNPEKNYYEDATVSASDFNVNIVYGDGTTEATTDFVITYPLGQAALVEGDNLITITYAPGGTPTSDTDTVNIVAASHGSASVIQVELIQGLDVKHDYYYADGIEWDFTGLSVARHWDDDSLDDTVSLADLVSSGDATISPASPTSNTTSFSVSYAYHEVDIDANSVSVTMHPDEAQTLGWTSRGTIDCFAGTTIAQAVNTASWSFTVTWKSGVPSTSLDVSNVGTGENQIHLGLYDTSTPSSEGTPLALSYPFTAADDGKFLVAFYKGARTGQNQPVSITPRLNSIKREAGAESGYFRIESISELSAGDRVIIANYTESADLYTTKVYDSQYHNIRSVAATQSIVGTLHEITPAGATETYTVESGTESGSWSFKENSTNQYIAAASDSSNHAKTVEVQDANASFNLAIDSGAVTAVAQGEFSRNHLRYNYNGGDPLFSCYSNGQDPIALYKYMDHIPEAEFANVNLKAQKAVIEFATYLNEQMAAADVCGADVVDDSSAAFNTAWTNVSNKYTALFVTENTGDDAGTYGTYKLTSAELSHAKAMLQYGYATWENDTRGGTPGVERDCLQRALKTYDFVVLNYEKTPFMSSVRTPSLSGYIPGRYANPDSPLTTTLWIVLASGMTGLAAIGAAYFFSKKKRERA